MQANTTFGVCDLPQAGVTPAPPGAVSQEIGFGYLNSKPARLQWLLGTAFVALLLSL